MPEIREIVGGYADPDGPLELDSLSMVQLVEDLEDAFGIVVTEADFDPKHFAMLATVTAFVAARHRSGHSLPIRRPDRPRDLRIVR